MKTIWKRFGKGKMIALYIVAAIVLLAFYIGYDLGFISKANYIHNYETEEYPETLASINPSSIKNGLAMYSIGEGNPILLFPYPHADAEIPIAYSELANVLVSLKRRVLSFDPPGAFFSTALPKGDMEEMLNSALTTLEEMDIKEKIDLIGHSMGSLCALAFAINYPEKVNNLILIGSMSGFPAAVKHGMPGSTWNWTNIEYWKVMWWGMKLTNGRGNLELHKKLSNVMGKASFYNTSLFKELTIDPEDRSKGIPIRRIWSKNLWKNIDFTEQLGIVRAKTLICAGRHDTQTPIVLNEELSSGIPNSKMVVFEQSGHFPFIEETDRFTSVLEEFFVGG